MDLAKVLVRSIVRAFYETQHVVIIDALVNHSALSVADLALVLDLGSTSQKIAQRLCGKLKEGGLVSVFVRQEIKEGAMKPTNKEYFYIDYRRAIDATKYKVHMLDERIKAESKPTQEKKELRCPTCHAEYTYVEVLDSRAFNTESGFACRRCGSGLAALPREEDAQARDDTPARFNKQFGAILNLLQQIDDTTVPPTTGEEALANQLAMPRDKILNPGAKSTAVVVPAAKPTAVRGMASGPEKIELNITDNATLKAAEEAAAIAQAAKTSELGQLPSWHTKSTVIPGASFVAAGAAPDTPTSLSTGVLKEEEEDEKKDLSGDATLDEYFASLAQEQARAPSDEEDDEEDEFEDVMAPSVAVVKESPPAAKRARVESSEDEDEFEDAI